MPIYIAGHKHEAARYLINASNIREARKEAARVLLVNVNDLKHSWFFVEKLFDVINWSGDPNGKLKVVLLDKFQPVNIRGAEGKSSQERQERPA